MNTSEEHSTDRKSEIMEQIAELSRLLAMMPQHEAGLMHEPLTRTEMPVSDWLREARETFLKLSLLLGKELDVQMQ